MAIRVEIARGRTERRRVRKPAQQAPREVRRFSAPLRRRKRSPVQTSSPLGQLRRQPRHLSPFWIVVHHPATREETLPRVLRPDAALASNRCRCTWPRRDGTSCTESGLQLGREALPMRGLFVGQHIGADGGDWFIELLDQHKYGVSNARCGEDTNGMVCTLLRRANIQPWYVQYVQLDAQVCAGLTKAKVENSRVGPTTFQRFEGCRTVWSGGTIAAGVPPRVVKRADAGFSRYVDKTKRPRGQP